MDILNTGCFIRKIPHLADDVDMVLCLSTGEDGAEDEENPSPDNVPPVDHSHNQSRIYLNYVLFFKYQHNFAHHGGRSRRGGTMSFSSWT